MDGKYNFEGRLEFCFGGIWGTVCDDSWDTTDAEVVCRQLGFNTTTGAQALRMASLFGQGTGPIYLDNVGCTGSEERLTSCPRPNPIGEHNCEHSEDAGVRCFTQGEKIVVLPIILQEIGNNFAGYRYCPLLQDPFRSKITDYLKPAGLEVYWKLGKAQLSHIQSRPGAVWLLLLLLLLIFCV